jgi:hypothetical protein
VSAARAVLLTVAVLAVAGCGGDDEPASAGGPVTLSTPTAAPTASPAPASGGASAPGVTAVPGLPPRPAPGACVDVPEAPDGRYTVYDAGSVVVRRDGDRLALGEVRTGEGWTSRVDDQDGDSVEVDLRRGDEHLDLEVEVDDGRVEAEICADDD